MNEYKNKNILEKSWILYSNICDLGLKLNKDAKDEGHKKQIINSYLKYLPGFDDIKDLLSNELTSIETFTSMYCDYLNVNLDEEIIWPYHWHLNL